MSNKFLAWCFSFKQKFGMLLRIAASRAPSKSISDIPRSDPVGDALQEDALKARARASKDHFTIAQKRAIDDEIKAGRPWMAKLLERKYMGTEVQKELNEIIKTDPRLKGVTSHGRGPDYTQEGNRVKYELLTDSKWNMQKHATRPGIKNELIRYIKFPPK